MAGSSLRNDLQRRRERNAAKLAVFGVDATQPAQSARYRTIREGDGPTIFTIGYERRTGEELIDLLRNAGVEVLVDVRERAMSRRADFRGKALAQRCEASGIDYQPMRGLGSTNALRDRLKESGDIKAFHSAFRRHSLEHQADARGELANLVKTRTAALICYERDHEDCHRSTIADLVAEATNASIVAI
jgi:uncharacterized protein (DUF488 family)